MRIWHLAMLGLSANCLALSYAILLYCQDKALEKLLLGHLLSLLQGYSILGFGLGLPVICLASVLGWAQILLLLSGQISPHLLEKDFLHAIKTIYRSLFEN